MDMWLEMIGHDKASNVEEVPNRAQLSGVVDIHEPLNAKTRKERRLLPWQCLHFSALCLWPTPC